MVEFLKKAMDWVLEKEAEAANKCAIDPEDIEKQIKIVEAKKEELRKKCEEENAEFEHILQRLSLIKASLNNCKEE